MKMNMSGHLQARNLIADGVSIADSPIRVIRQRPFLRTRSSLKKMGYRIVGLAIPVSYVYLQEVHLLHLGGLMGSAFS